MGIVRFDERWWIKGHGMFGAHEEKCLLKTHDHFLKIAYYYRAILNL
jgi:hypothetical protein